MKGADYLILFVLIALLIGGSWFLWKNLPLGSEKYGSYSINLSELPAGSQISSNYTQFYPNMRYKDRNISYWIEDVCSDAKIKAIDNALAILSNLTVLRFYLDGKDAEIRYLCSRTSPTPEVASHYVAGEGGPVEIINASKYSLIKMGEVSLYTPEKCDKPQVTIHETLHALGFEHNSNPNSILYPVTDCSQQIEESIIEYIDNLYVTDSLPDLTIESASAQKSEGYIEFNITVSNIGLDDANDIKLRVLSDSTLIKEFALGNIPAGSRKYLGVSGLALPIGFGGNKLVFEVSTAGGQSEISMSNNRVELNVI